MKATTRSVSGAVLMLAIIPIIVGLLACLPVPVGDPERSRIDPEMNGVWAMTQDGADKGLYLFRPWDKRTWLVLGIEDGGSADQPVVVYKAWLKKLGGEQFMTWELAGGMQEDGTFQAEYWLVFRVDLDGENQMNLRILDYEFTGFEGIPEPDGYEGNYVRDMRRRFERVIKQHADNDEMYGDTMVLRRVPDDELEAMAKRFQKYVEFD